MKAEIICIGTELLLGQTKDTNAWFLARELADLGIDLYHKTTVGDNLGRIVAVLRQAWERSDVLILSGGLGPTKDDLTREAIGQLLGEALEFREEVWQAVELHMIKRNRPLSDNNRRQAMYPRSAQALANPWGTAPAVLVDQGGKYLFAFPGVPRELYGLWERYAEPLLQEKLLLQGRPVLTSKIIRLIGIGESDMESRIIDLIDGQTNPTIAPYVGQGDVTLRITAKGSSETENSQKIQALYEQVVQRLGSYIYGFDQDNLEQVVGGLLRERGLTLAVAESCTGGLLADRITNVAGSSAYYLGGVNSYSNQLKMDILGVPEDIIAKHGAVSPETAAAMAAGIKEITGADFTIGITGIAGPDGGSAEKPVGLVYIGIAGPQGAQVIKEVFPYDRRGNKAAAAQRGLTLLWQALKQF